MYYPLDIPILSHHSGSKMPPGLSLTELYKFFSLCFTLAYYLVYGINAITSILFSILDAIVMVIGFLLSFVPGVLSVVKYSANISFLILAHCFDGIQWTSKPIVKALDTTLYIILPSHLYHKISYYTQVLFSYATVYVLSLILVIVGSLIIATEERGLVRNKFRPKTTVPLICLISGVIMHYDTVRYSSWLPSAVLLTGTAWYCVSIAHDDIVQRARAADLERWQRHRGENMHIGGGIHPTHDLNGRLLRRRNMTSSISGTDVTPSKLERSGNSGKFRIVDSTKCNSHNDGKSNQGRPIPIDIIQEDSCPICLEDFINNEVLRVLPCCNHTFHENCVGSWLEINEHCPLCRTAINTSHTGWGYLVHALFE